MKQRSIRTMRLHLLLLLIGAMHTAMAQPLCSGDPSFDCCLMTSSKSSFISSRVAAMQLAASLEDVLIKKSTQTGMVSFWQKVGRNQIQKVYFDPKKKQFVAATSVSKSPLNLAQASSKKSSLAPTSRS